MVAKQEVERTKEGRSLTMVHSSFSSALNALHPDIDWNASSPFTEKQFHLRLLDNIKHKLAIAQVLSHYLFPSALPPPLPLCISLCSHIISIVCSQDWDWYFISNKKFMIPHGGFTLLLHYGSLFNMLKSLHPDIRWHESKFLNDKANWNSREHRRALMDIIGQQLSIHQVLCLAYLLLVNPL